MQEPIQVFISYRNLPEYVKWTETLKTWLETRGYRVWLDRDSISRGITPTSVPWRRAIAQGIRESQVMLVVYAPECFDSEIVVDEWELGRANGLHVHFLKVKDVPIKNILPGYVHVQYIDVARGDAWGILEQELKKAQSNPPKPSDDPFAAYLRDALEAMFTIIHARTDEVGVGEIDLRVRMTPDQVEPTPMPVRSSRSSMKVRLLLREGLTDGAGTGEDGTVEIETLEQGREKLAGRLLLLGEPGAGKSFTLYRYAYKMLKRRQSEGVSVPLPILMLCTTWRSSQPQPLIDWIREAWVGLENLREDDLPRCLLLLDGLDELGAERSERVKEADGKEIERTYDPRLRFLEVLPEQGAVILSTRIDEYRDIGQKARLNGAVRLLPLDDEHIRVYLINYPALWDALRNDAELLEMVRTPLLLSYVTFAYRDDPYAVRFLNDKDRLEVSDAIFKRYVRERYEHEARRLVEIGQEPHYTLETIYDVLGRAAMASAGGGKLKLKWLFQANIFNVDDFADLVEEAPDFLKWVELIDLMSRSEAGLRFNHLQLRDYFGRLYALEHLSDPDVSMRRAAVGALKRIGNAQAVEPLIDRLKDEDIDVRRAAIGALVSIGTPAVEPLIARLKDEHSEVRGVSAWALGQIRDARAMEPLIASLEDEDEDVRRVSAWALGQIRDARAMEPLIARLKDEHSEVRRVSAWALGQIRDARAMEPLIARLKDEHSDVRRVSVWALGRIGDVRAVEPLIARLKDEHSDVKKATIKALSRVGMPAVEPLIARLEDNDKDIRPAAAKALGRIGDVRAVEPLIARLKDEDKDVRRAAAKALGRIGDARAVEPLIARLKDEDENKYVIGTTAWALWKIGDARAVEPLITRLKDERWEVKRVITVALSLIGLPAVEPLIARLENKNLDKDVRRAVTEALAQIGDTRAIEPLIYELGYEEEYFRQVDVEALERIGALAVEPLIARLEDENEDKDVRRAAAWALGQIGDEKTRELLIARVRTVEPLTARLEDDGNDVRRAAAWALGQTGDERTRKLLIASLRSVEPLIARLEDNDKDIRRAAAEALMTIGAPAVKLLIVRLEDEDKDVRRAAAWALGQIGDEQRSELLIARLQAVEPLIARLEDEDKDVRRAVAWALRRIGDARAVEALIARLEDEDKDVRRTAAEELGQIRDAHAVEPLIARLEDEDKDVRRAAAWTLRRIGDARAVEPLIARLEDEDKDVRRAADEALEEIRNARAAEPLHTYLEEQVDVHVHNVASLAPAFYQSQNESELDYRWNKWIKTLTPTDKWDNWMDEWDNWMDKWDEQMDD